MLKLGSANPAIENRSDGGVLTGAIEPKLHRRQGSLRKHPASALDKHPVHGQRHLSTDAASEARLNFSEHGQAGKLLE
jgi:hypothetical protein